MRVQKFFRVIPPDTKIDFVGKAKYMSTISLILCVVSLVAIVTKGFNYGIDFTGGTSVQLQFKSPKTPDQVRAIADKAGAQSAEVRSLGKAEGSEASDFLIVARSIADMKGEEALANRMVKEGGGAEQVKVMAVDVVGPRTGAELRSAAILSLLYSILLIMIYIWLRFDLMFAPGAILALLEDIIIVAGFYVLTGWEFTITSVAVLLTIAGYGVNDTIVIYDRIRETMKAHGGKVPLAETINDAINKTLSRTCLTALITFISVIPIIVFCEDELRGFGIAMALGIVVGVISTTFIAVPFTLKMEKIVAKFRGENVRGSSPRTA